YAARRDLHPFPTRRSSDLGSAPFPDPIRWSGGGGAFVGNTMASGVFSRGVVTFDANNLWQVPYDTVDAFHQVSADTLASLASDRSEEHTSEHQSRENLVCR